jgi:hypothetical protein
MTSRAKPRRWSSLVATCLLVLAVSACGSAPDPNDLEGLWFVTREAGSERAFGTSGAMSLAFDEGSAGAARFLGRRASGVTVCATYDFTRAGSTLTLRSDYLASPTFEIDRLDDDTFTLTADELVLTLTRIAGESPVQECGSVSTVPVGSISAPLGTWSRLSSAGSNLYVNLASAGDPVAGFDLQTAELGPPRTYSRGVSGGIDRWVVAARTDALFYGHCACGGSVRLGFFDLEADEPIAQVNGATAFDVPIRIRHGAYHDDTGTVTIGGDARDGSGANRLVTLDGETLDVLGELTVLPRETIHDVTFVGDTLFALVGSRAIGGPYLVPIGRDGNALATYPVPPSAVGPQAVGITTVGGTLYAATTDATTLTTHVVAITLEEAPPAPRARSAADAR